MAVKNWVLDTPPRLSQLQIYKGEEATMACWATCAEMIVKWKSRSSYFARPTFTPPSQENSEKGFDDRIRYLLSIEEWLSSWGVETQNDGSYGVWAPETIATLLKTRGPLLSIGDFGSTSNPLRIGGLAHAVVVYGYAQKFGGVYYVDPWDADTRLMSLSSFREKLWKSRNSVYARKPNYRDVSG